MKNSSFKNNFSLNGTSADVVLVGGGPLSFGVLEALRQELGSNSKIILLERNNRFEGSGWASVKHFRTYQTHVDLSLAVKQTVDWYEALSRKDNQVNIYRFPYIFIAKSQEQLDIFAKNLETVRKLGFGKDAKIVSRQQLREQFPFIQNTEYIVGALIYPDAGWLNLPLGIEYIINTAKNTDFYLNTTMQEIVIKKNKIQGVQTSSGFIKTNKVVLSPGQFIYEAIDSINGAKLANGETLKKVIYIQKRQSFEGNVKDLPANTKFFLIAENGAYVRIITDNQGNGQAMYGFADTTVPYETDPKLNPEPDGMKFAQSVYNSLESLMPQYKKGGDFFVSPANSRAGYYVETPDHLPIVSDTNIPGLYLCAALSHLGVMTHIGQGKHMVEIMKGNVKNNPFTINRSFQKGVGSVL